MAEEFDSVADAKAHAEKYEHGEGVAYLVTDDLDWD
jgi:hypothetical protein